MFRPETTIAGALSDIYEHMPTPGDLDDIQKAFRGEAVIKPPCRIPAADDSSDIFFGDREFLIRFSALPLPTQKCFLIAIRGVLDKNATNKVQIRIMWSATKTKELVVTRTNSNLDFDLL